MDKKTDPTKLVHGELDSLVKVFYDDLDDLGRFTVLTADSLPEPQRSLLNHEHHMTVTLEKFHSSMVVVDVLRAKQLEGEYVREILLRRRTDHQVVQYGIVRLNFGLLGDEIQSEIEGQQVPLGRILIKHDVMRRVQLLSLFCVENGAALAAALAMGQGETCFGRTALIHCNNQPAVELLEIVKIPDDMSTAELQAGIELI